MKLNKMAYRRERNRRGWSRIGASHCQIAVKQGAKEDFKSKKIVEFSRVLEEAKDKLLETVTRKNKSTNKKLNQERERMEK